MSQPAWAVLAWAVLALAAVCIDMAARGRGHEQPGCLLAHCQEVAAL